MKSFMNIFHKKEKQEPKPLRIEGIPPAPMTPEPDEAEMAAMALLEEMSKGTTGKDLEPMTDDHSAAYYYRLAERIRKAYASANMQASRFLAFCEQELKKRHLPKEGSGSLVLLEAGLYNHINTVEREQGELKRRWQHCLAEVTVRLMDIPNK